MEWAPTERVLMGKVAWPEPSRNCKPRLVTPSKRETVPLGVPLPGAAAVTVAVKVTEWPKTTGLVEEVTVVVVLARLTVWVRGEAGDAVKEGNGAAGSAAAPFPSL